MQDGEAHEEFPLSPPEELNEKPPKNSSENGDLKGEGSKVFLPKNKYHETESLQEMLRGMVKKEGTIPENLNNPQIQKSERKGFLKGIFELIKSILRIFGFPIKSPQPQAI